MNGLEAIELMKQGKMVSAEMKDDEVIITKIENNKVYWLFEYELEDDEWKENDYFDFTLEYEEYKPKPLTGWERIKGDVYHSIASNSIIETIELSYGISNEHHKKANYFSTKEKAEEIDFKQTLFRKLQRFSDENGGSAIDWSDGEQRKYYIFYNHDGDLDCYWNYTDKNFGIVYFVSSKVVNKAIELFHDDLIKYFTM